MRSDEKPLSKDSFNESNKVFINAQNKHYIQKNENEYLASILDATSLVTCADSPIERSYETK